MLDTKDKKSLNIDKKIYKANYLLDDKIKDIYVFYGSSVDDKDKEDVQSKVFTKEELAYNNENNVNVVFIEDSIRFDDTINTIKHKIMNAISDDVYLEEMYLFCSKLERVSSVNIYETLTQNKRREITYDIFEQFLSNIVKCEDGSSVKMPEDQDKEGHEQDKERHEQDKEENDNNAKHKEDKIYTYDDVIKLDINNKKCIINKPLGQKFIIKNNVYPFVTNPYKLTSKDDYFEANIRRALSTLNNNLLLNTGEIVDNNIYITLASDVLKYYDAKSDNVIGSDSILQIYYPFLYNKNINTLDDLNDNKEKLTKNEKTSYTNSPEHKLDESINMFYDVYYLKTKELNYTNNGVKYIKFALKPEYDIKMPLDIIFKLIHATKDKPIIKYNSSYKQENIYRVYTDNLSTDGRKIPALKKSLVFKFVKHPSKQKSITIYAEHIDNNKTDVVMIELLANGIMKISAELDNIITLSKLTEMLGTIINPFLKDLKIILEQHIYNFHDFTDLYDENVEILQLTYGNKIKLVDNVDIESIKSCITGVFNIEQIKSLKDIQLRFKRVSNFNKVNSQEAFVIEKSEQGLRGNEIVDALLENFKDQITRTEAEELIIRMANEYEVERTAHKSETKIRDSPGFKTLLTVDTQDSLLTIHVEGINNINYMETIPIYLDTLVRLTQKKKNTEFSEDNIKKICDMESDVEDVVVAHDDIVSVSEKSHKEIKEDEEDYDDLSDESEYLSDVGSVDEKDKGLDNVVADKPAGALDLFFDDDDDDDEEEEEDEDDDDEGYEKSSISQKQDSEQTGGDVEEPDNNEPHEESKNKVHDDVDSNSSNGNMNVRNIDGMKLSKPYYFQSLIEKNDPVLVLKEDSGKYNSYSRTCSSDTRRQPVILTDKQLEKINKEHEGFLRHEDVVKYGSDRNNQFNYICPRYWCLKNNTIINPDELKEVVGKNGKKELMHPTCGKVLDKKDKTVKPGYYIYEFYPDKNLKATNKTIKPTDDVEVLHNDNWEKAVVVENSKENKNNFIVKIKKTNEETTVNVNNIHHKYKRYPNFQLDKHPDGHCVPCCFDKYNTEGKIHTRKVCDKKMGLEDGNESDSEGESESESDKEPTDEDADEDKAEVNADEADSEQEDGKDAEQKDKKKGKEREKDKPKPQNITKEDEYIKGPDKFPLGPGRWGYLPPEIQFILRQVNLDCQISNTNTNIKPNHPCLLRHGVETSNIQSFIACISDALFFGKNYKDEDGNIKPMKVLTIADMRKLIIKSLNLDNFIKYQNGNLVNDFWYSKGSVSSSETPNYDKYKNTKLYSKINLDVKAEAEYLNKVINAFNNFVGFLSDNDALITHTYLWDIVSYPNKYLFPNGVNLVIFEIPADDITNNVQLVCPTNHYSSQFYESRKPTIILMKEGHYYEPIYVYKTGDKISITKEFKELDPTLSRSIRDVITEVIKPFYSSICKPKDSLPTVYKAKRPLLLHDLINKLMYYNYDINKFVLNFNNKVIGVVAQEPSSSGTGANGFVPCYPSSNYSKINNDYVFMTDVSLWNDYYKTVGFLMKIYNKNKKIKSTSSHIPCKPILKVVEDDMVVGIITETNQFIQLSEPIVEKMIHHKNNLPDLPSIRNNNYVITQKNGTQQTITNADVEITTSKKVDEKRIDFIKRIKLENNFYAIFRNTIKILLNDYSNLKIRKDIEEVLGNSFLLYTEKFNKIEELFKKLVGDKVQFIGDADYYKMINEVSSCLYNDVDECRESKLCTVTDNNECGLIVPKQNLITQNSNHDIYFGKITDEIIRYNRINSFLLNPKTYLTLSDVDYILNDDEIILLQSSLTSDYFDGLTPGEINKYAKHNSYDEVNPIMTQTYDNTVVDIIKKEVHDQSCVKINDKVIGIWNRCFPNDYKEAEYSDSVFCGYQMIIDLVFKYKGQAKTINQIKMDLIKGYNKYMPNHGDKIIDILISEGKKNKGLQVKTNKLSFVNFLLLESYYLTILDIWMLITYYEIPAIFISSKPFLHTNYDKRIFIGYGSKETEFAFIWTSALRAGITPKYKIITYDNRGDIAVMGDMVDVVDDTKKEETMKEKTMKEETKKEQNNNERKDMNYFISLDDISEDCRYMITEAEKVYNPLDKYLEMYVGDKGAKTKKPKKIVIEDDAHTEPPVEKETKTKKPKTTKAAATTKPKRVKKLDKKTLIIDDDA